MKSLINYKKKSINELWDKLLYIPIYQREFVWDDEQIQNAIRTIFDDKNEEIQSYMGNILVVEKSDGKVKYKEIVDGQQRMTFNFMLLKCIYELIDELKVNISEVERNSTFIFDNVDSTMKDISDLLTIGNSKERVEVSHQARIFYSSKKLNNRILSLLNGLVKGVPSQDSRTTIVQMHYKLKNLIASRIINPNDFSMKDYPKIENEKESKEIIKELNGLFSYISNESKYIEITLNDEKYATEIFERMNSTSKPLTDYELFKNYIAGQLIKMDDRNVEQSINELDDLVNTEQNKLDTNSIIRSLLYLKEGRVTKDKYKFHKLKNIYNDLNDPKQMYDEVKNLIQTYRNLEELSIEKNEEEIILPYIIIKTFNFKQLRPALISMVITYGYTKEVKKLFMLLISIIFKRIVFDGDVANVIESLLHQTFRDEEEKLSTPELIIKEIKSKSWYKDIVKMKINQKSFDSIKKNEFIRILFIYSINKSFGNINILFINDDSDFNINLSNLHIEHILPRSWEKNWTDVVGEMDNNERAELIDNPGNKMPILGKINIKASNESFKDKKEKHYVLSTFNDIKTEDKNSNDKLVIMKVDGIHTDFIDANDVWNAKIIKERSIKLKEDFETEINKWLV